MFGIQDHNQQTASGKHHDDSNSHGKDNPKDDDKQVQDKVLDEIASLPDPGSVITSPASTNPISHDTPHHQPTSQDDHHASQDTSDLVNIKQEALEQLKPLVGHLQQTPEEKFRTTLMLLQATDDQSFVKEAYEAAKAITDEKVRAQALLDVVNEINYFTQQKPQ